MLYFEDSGAPESSSDYVTLILVHGAMVNSGMPSAPDRFGFEQGYSYMCSGVFRRMLPFASANNLRLVLVNKRDYRGSTPYSQEELKDLASPDRGV